LSQALSYFYGEVCEIHAVHLSLFANRLKYEATLRVQGTEGL